MTTYRVVCIYPNGNIHSRPFGGLDEADAYLCECSQSNRFASGSIWTDDDEELCGFGADSDSDESKRGYDDFDRAVAGCL